MSDDAREKFLATLEKRGRAEVQQQLDSHIFQGERKRLAETFVVGELRAVEEGHRRAEGDRGAELVGHADDANRIAREANRISKEANRVAVAAFILAAIALALSLGLFF